MTIQLSDPILTSTSSFSAKLTCLDLGSGHCPVQLDPYFVISVDARKDMNPTICCDLKKIPLDSNSVDMIYSSHVLEHFTFSEIHGVLTEWLRVLKVGGEIMLRLPDITYACRSVLNNQYDAVAQAVLYGSQQYPLDFHKCGFTPGFLASFLKQFPVTGRITTPAEMIHDMVFSGTKIS
jgi:predicted SAM-dependent methyltransferase